LHNGSMSHSIMEVTGFDPPHYPVPSTGQVYIAGGIEHALRDQAAALLACALLRRLLHLRCHTRHSTYKQTTAFTSQDYNVFCSTALGNHIHPGDDRCS
jgi:hypothetical protein